MSLLNTCIIYNSKTLRQEPENNVIKQCVHNAKLRVLLQYGLIPLLFNNTFFSGMNYTVHTVNLPTDAHLLTL